MVEGNLIIYKISCEGTLELIDATELIEAFTETDVLVIFNQESKRLHVWKGNHLDRMIGKYVPEAKDLILRNDRTIRILRHIVVESGSEPQEFFDDLGLRPDLLNAQLKKLDQIPKENADIIDGGKLIEEDLEKKAIEQEKEAKIFQIPTEHAGPAEDSSNKQVVMPNEHAEFDEDPSIELARWEVLPSRMINNVSYSYESIFTNKVAAQQRLMELSAHSKTNEDVKLVTILRAKFKGQGPFNDNGIGYAIYVRNLKK